VQQVEQLGCTLKDFYSHHYNAFDGSLGPKVAESWTTNLQMLFEELGCTNEQKVRYAALLFTGEALWWWQSKKELLTQELGHGVVVTWTRFKQEYYDRFFPRAQQQMRVKEFQNLVQGNLTVEQYFAKFMELARFALNLIPDKESKTERFLDGLHPRWRNLFRGLIEMALYSWYRMGYLKFLIEGRLLLICVH